MWKYFYMVKPLREGIFQDIRRDAIVHNHQKGCSYLLQAGTMVATW
jgi:hypothetical protein